MLCTDPRARICTDAHRVRAEAGFDAAAASILMYLYLHLSMYLYIYLSIYLYIIVTDERQRSCSRTNA